MRATVLLAALVAVVCVASSNARPSCGCGGVEIEKAKKSSSSAASTSATQSTSSDSIKSVDGCGNSYSKDSSKSASATAAASSSQSEESYEYSGSGGGSGCGCGGGSSRGVSDCGCQSGSTKRTVIEEDIKVVYAKKDSESITAYYERITTMKTGETMEAYCRRMGSIYEHFSSLDLWRSRKYLCYTKTYYQYTYRQYDNEKEIDYYKRMFTRNQGESDEFYFWKMNVIQCLYPNLKCWYAPEYKCYTEKYYTFIYKKCSCDSSETAWYKRILERYNGESDSCYLNRMAHIQNYFSNLSFWNNCQYQEIWEPYYKMKYARRSCESDNEYYTRCLHREEWEKTDIVYYSRLNILYIIFGSSFDVFGEKCTSYMKGYYTSYWGKKDTESREDYLKRVLTVMRGERQESAIKRIKTIIQYNTGCGCFTSEYLSKIEATKCFSTEYFNLIRKSCGFTDSYERKDGEDIIKYYQRITCKNAGESMDDYIVRIDKFQEKYSNLDLWSSQKYITSYLTEYFRYSYRKLNNEKESDYYARILKRKCSESDEAYYRRLLIIQKCYPNMKLWYLSEYTCYTEKYYTFIYKKCSCDSSETAWYKRILEQYEGESDSVYLERMQLVGKCHSSSMGFMNEYTNRMVWESFYKKKYARRSCESDDEYLARCHRREPWEKTDIAYATRIHYLYIIFGNSFNVCNEKYTKVYYTIYWGKRETESCEDYLKRVMTRCEGECQESAIKRMALIKKYNSSCGCFTYDIFSKIEATKCFSTEYFNLVRKCFGFTESYEKKSSSSSSACSSASSSSNEEEVVVKRGSC